jgi:hypothetical protein
MALVVMRRAWPCLLPKGAVSTCSSGCPKIGNLNLQISRIIPLRALQSHFPGNVHALNRAFQWGSCQYCILTYAQSDSPVTQKNGLP